MTRMNLKKALISLAIAVMILPGLSFAQEAEGQIVPKSCAEGAPCEFSELFQVGTNVIGFLINAVTILGFVAVAIAGLMMLSSGGNQERYEQGKKIMWYAVIGLVLAFASRIIVATIISQLGGKV